VQGASRDGNRASEVIKRLGVMFSHKQPSSETVDLNDAAREVFALSASYRYAGLSCEPIWMPAHLP
jgi:hypothetical protein